MSVHKRAESKLKLDELLRAGASGRCPVIDIDKAISSTTHRLMKEVLTFTKHSTCLDNSQQFRNLGFSMLESKNESLAISRLAKLMTAEEIPQDALNLSLKTKTKNQKYLKPRTKGIKKKLKLGKNKASRKFCSNMC